MSMNVAQVLAANPVTTVTATDTFYLAFNNTTDAAITGANLKAAMSPLTTKGDLFTYSTVNARLAVGATDGQILQVSSGAATGLAWSTPTYPSASGTAGKILRSDGTNNVYTTSTFADTYAVSTILYASSANVVAGLATANSASLVTNGSGVPAWQTLSAGQVLIGTTAGAPAAAAINSGTGILVQNGSGSITVSLSGPGTLTWNNVAGTSQTAAVNNGYICSNAGATTVTIPATAVQGSVIGVQGTGAGGWVLQANAGQTIHDGNVATSVAGTLTSTNQWDSVQVLCVIANTTFAVIASQGSLTAA